MTLERAPWPVRRALGHFGAYREGVGQLVGRLRDSFDPGTQCALKRDAAGGRRESSGVARTASTPDRRSRPLDALRALRLLPPRLPHLPRHRRRGRQPARADRADARAGADEIGARRRRAGAAPRRLPRLPRVRAGLPVGRRVRPWAGGGAGAAVRRAHGLPPLARAVLGVFRHEALWRPLFTAARALRATGSPRLLAAAGRFGFGMGMLAATRPRGERAYPSGAKGASRRSAPSLRSDDAPPPTVALFRGCVMDTLFRHVHDATRRTLEHNGYRVVEVEGQACCGALHEHAGDRDAAAALARRNVAALRRRRRTTSSPTAPGCGALLKDYGHLLDDDAGRRPSAAKVRDVSELLAAAGPRPGAPLDLDVAYDAPCHLQHAQRVHDAPLAVLRAIPGLRPPAAAGLGPLLRQRGHLLGAPARRWRARSSPTRSRTSPPPTRGPQVVATGNPGCLMQIGAGLMAAGLDIPRGASGRAAGLELPKPRVAGLP